MRAEGNPVAKKIERATQLGAGSRRCSYMGNRITLAALAAILSILSLAACDPRLPGDSTAGAGGDQGLSVTLDPAAPLGEAPRVLRARAVFPGRFLDPAQLFLFRDEVGPGQLRAIGRGEISKTLAERQVPARAWREGSEALLAPEAPLEPGARYTLVVGELPEAVTIAIASDAPAPLPRVWPPDGASGTVAFAVWCGESSLPRIDAEMALSPYGARGRVYRGASEGAGARCVRFVAEAEIAKGGQPPPVITVAMDERVTIALDPRPIAFDAETPPLVALACEEGETPFGPGCARVGDDRITGRSPGVPLLWAVAGAGTDSVFTTRPSDPFVIAGLPPAADIALDVAAIDASGKESRSLFTAVTAPPQPHVVINEVLADPLGSEPSAEWVEIVNDGHAPVTLDGYALVDGGGSTPLPSATLAPGEFALVVNESFLLDDGVDPAPAPGTRILRVPHLGKGGLANAGEPLALLDGEGNTISRFPATPKPKAGKSVARRTPSAVDALASSFDLATPSPGRANTW
jgi:hypothetical protein